MRVTRAGVIVCCLLILAAWPARPALAQVPLCSGSRLLVEGGHSDVLGVFGEFGVRCPPGPGWALAAGLRYTDQRAGVLPFALLTYTRPLGAGWRFGLTASARERAGDYEIDRLPELYLWWTLPGTPSRPSLMPSLQVFAGSITTLTLQPQPQTTRVGGALTLTLPLGLGPMAELTPSLQLGALVYGTRQHHSYWVGTVNLTIRPAPRTEVGFAYLRQEGSGTSPLAFDQVNPDHLLTARVSRGLTSSDWVHAAITFTLVAPPATVKEYVLSWSRAGAWTVSVTYRQTDGKVFVGLTLPR